MMRISHDNRETADPSSRPTDGHGWQVWWLGAASFVLLTTALVAVGWEWSHYRQVIARLGVRLSKPDRLAVAWLLIGKSLLVYLPILCIGGLLAWRRRWRLAAGCTLTGCTAVTFWLVADLRVQQIVGQHVLDFVPYLVDAARMPATANHLEWAGDNRAYVLESLITLLAICGAGGASWHACRWAAGVTFRLAGRGAACLSWSGAAILILCAGGAGVAPWVARQPLCLRQVKAALPVDVSFFEHLAEHTVTSLRIDRLASAPKQVSIVSLVANPAGPDPGREQVHLHNFTNDDVPLDDWRLENNAREHQQLSGPIPAGQTRVITLPAGSMPLRNAGDRVRLFHADRLIHQVSYTKKEAKYGGVLQFRDGGDYNAFERRLRDQAQATYRELFPRITTAKPADDQACFHRARPPNVVYFVLESLRASVLAPEIMGGIDAWSRKGLRCERHYAGTNSSHLGLFALLYGRSPMVYDSTLDAQVPPQTARSLRNSGYETIFITAGDCRGFRRMGEFLNEHYFDRVITDPGDEWLDRPARDQRVLEQVRRLATEPCEKPRFITVFLMSTHFPYTFPPEFQIHRPCGDHVTYQNWQGMDREVLHNRYRNAARFLENELLRVVRSLDPRRTVIVFTGDHGESMGEDGGLAHGSRASEAQTRVPLVMVGPGVPALRIEQPTTHVDVLPTLLHILAERHVPVAHAHGRDLLSSTLEDTAIITPFRWKQPYDLMLIRGQQRLQFSYRLDSPEIDVYGFCDEAANLDLKTAQEVSPEEAADWSGALRRELERISR